MTALSGRTRTALMRHQNQLITQANALRTADRVLSGALVACDPITQREMLVAYFESLQEVRVCLQRLEGFLGKRVTSVAVADAPVASFASSSYGIE